MYCGSCIRDNVLVRELQRLGHEAALVPIYTPIRTDSESVAMDRVFYGAIHIYLLQKVPFLSRLPGFLTNWTDRPSLLKRVPTDGSTDAKQLGELAVSTLQGEEGRQRSELEKLANWLRDDYRPEVVQLTNSMLLGFAHVLKERLPDALLVCTLQGEDIFLDDLQEPWRGRVIELLRQRATDVDLFVATSESHADHMTEVLQIPRERIQVTRIGIDLEGHEVVPPRPGPPWTIGFVGRICPEKGLHHLVDAFRLLDQRLGRGRVKLEVAGYLGSRDRAYFEEQVAKLEQWGLSEHANLHGEVDREEKLALLRRCHVFTMPTVYQEAKGLSILEAMASGVPVVQPAHGAFPEILERTGGGVLVAPEDPEALARGLEDLLRDPERLSLLGSSARAGVEQHYSARVMAEHTLRSYGRGESG